MRKLLIAIIIILLVVIFLIIISINNTKQPAQPADLENHTYIPSLNSASKGDRILAIDINSQGENYGTDFALAKNSGMQATQLTLFWNMIETSKLKYDNNWLKTADSFYPSQKTKIALVIGVIDTNNDVRPSDLKATAFDSPENIERFEKLIDYIFSETPNLKIVSFSVGNEIDIYLGNDKEKWQEYTNFYSNVSDYIRSKKNIQIGSKATFNGLINKNVEQLKTLNEKSDIILVTYYPINSDFTVKNPEIVGSDFDALTSIYSKPIQILEAGYPSSSVLESSEKKQAEFIKQVFISWDKHSSQIKLINFVWLNDISDSKLNDFTRYYGISSNNFKEYLKTLGLRTSDGKDKLSFTALKQEAKARGG